jgi:hypothetical protein
MMHGAWGGAGLGGGIALVDGDLEHAGRAGDRDPSPV